MNERLKSLYQSVILKHNKTPFNFSAKQDADHTVLVNNPLCGDKFHFYIDSSSNQINDIHYHGIGCAISKASNSILAQSIENLTLQEAYNFCDQFLHYIETGEFKGPTLPEAFEAFSAVHEFPGRIDCATLGWKAMKNFFSTQLKLNNQ